MMYNEIKSMDSIMAIARVKDLLKLFFFFAMKRTVDRRKKNIIETETYNTANFHNTAKGPKKTFPFSKTLTS